MSAAGNPQGWGSASNFEGAETADGKTVRKDYRMIARGIIGEPIPEASMTTDDAKLRSPSEVPQGRY